MLPYLEQLGVFKLESTFFNNRRLDFPQLKKLRIVCVSRGDLIIISFINDNRFTLEEISVCYIETGIKRETFGAISECENLKCLKLFDGEKFDMLSEFEFSDFDDLLHKTTRKISSKCRDHQ